MLLLQQRIFDRKDYETGGMIIMIKDTNGHCLLPAL